MAASPAKVRQARSFLRRRGISSNQISPRKFANSSEESNRNFSELLRFLGRVLDENKPESRQRQEDISAAARAENK